jgi:mannitol/fructose-specific phosphotransferase system IIA component (Ntr-type)
MLADLLHPERVRVGLTLSDKEAALRAIASLLTMPEGTANEETVYEVLLERERLASTGIGSGVAIPHGRYDGVDELRAAVALCPAGVDFDAVDRLPVKIVVGIVGPRSMPRKSTWPPSRVCPASCETMRSVRRFSNRSTLRRRIARWSSPDGQTAAWLSRMMFG